MISQLITNSARFIILVLLQVLVLNNIHLGGFINPYLYAMFILLLPIETPNWIILPICFLIGITVDMFSSTMGLHAAACVAMGYCRPYLLRVIAPREGYPFEARPSLYSMSLRWFITYAGIMIFVHHFVLFYAEMFTFAEFFSTFLRVILSSILTLILIVISQYLFYRDKFRR